MFPSSTTDLSGFLITLRHLIREPSVVGAEDSFFRVLRRELEELDISVERHSGVLVARGGDPDEVILSAHVDRNGLVCTGPNEFQYAAFIAGNRGELTGDSVSEQMVATIADRFTGQRVQAHLPYTGTYIGQGTITTGYLCPKRLNLIFELDGLDYLEPGTPVAFLDRLTLTDTHISAQLDNVVSVALIIYLYSNGFQGTALFTAQEEAGRSWRYALAWLQRESISTNRMLVLDTSPYPDVQPPPSRISSCVKRTLPARSIPVSPRKSRSAVMNSEFATATRTSGSRSRISIGKNPTRSAGLSSGDSPPRATDK